MSEKELLKIYRDQADSHLETLLPSEHELPSGLHQAMRYSALAPGKRIRPVITMAACESVGGSHKNALTAGCAIELVHCFSLIHDDLPAIDNDDLRRGRPTCHVKFDEALAILAGDALFALAFELISNCSDDPKICLDCVRLLAQSSGSFGLVGGEVMDIQAEGQPGSPELLETIHLRKTAHLISACCQIGGVIGNGSKEQVKYLGEFGLKVGLIFQIVDDILNETSSEAQLGKAVQTDRDQEKLTYPALMGLEKSEQLARELLQEAKDILQKVEGKTHFLQFLAEYSLERDM